MPLRAPQIFTNDQRSFDQWTRSTVVVPDSNSVETQTIADQAVTNAKLRQSIAASVIGNPANAAAQPADIQAGADNTFLVRRTGTLSFAAIVDADVPNTIARETDITAAIAALQAQADPFPVYENQARADARYVQLANVLNGSATYDPPSLADGAGTTTTVSVTGALLGDFALASFSLDLQGITVSAYVSSADTVAVRFQNESGGVLALSSGTLRARVWRQ